MAIYQPQKHFNIGDKVVINKAGLLVVSNQLKASHIDPKTIWTVVEFTNNIFPIYKLSINDKTFNVFDYMIDIFNSNYKGERSGFKICNGS